MPPVEDMDLPHPAVLWERGGTDDFGNPTLSDPVQIDTFWTMKRTQTVDAKGEPIALDATVVTDRVVGIGAKMWKGELADFDDEGADEVMQVMWVSENTDLKDRWNHYTVGLTRFGDDLPVTPPP